MKNDIIAAISMLPPKLVEEYTVINFASDSEWHDVIYGTPSKSDLSRLKQFISSMKNKGLYDDVVVRLYHGTSANIDVATEGLLPTTNKRRRSYQSAPGYVYLSIYPSSAELFGEVGYPGEDVAVYQVDVPIKKILPDSDQLKNKRMWGGDESIGSSLTDSIVFGSGVRVKGEIPPYMIKRIK